MYGEQSWIPCDHIDQHRIEIQQIQWHNLWQKLER